MSDRVLYLDPRSLGLKVVMVNLGSRRAKVRRIIGYVALGFIAIGFMAMSAIPTGSGPETTAGAVFAVSILAAVLLGLVWMLMGYTRTTSSDAPEGEPKAMERELSAMPQLAKCKGKTILRADRALRRAFKAALPRFKAAGVVAVVEGSLEDSVRELPVDQGLLEEEPISGLSVRRILILSVVMGLLAISYGSRLIQMIASGEGTPSDFMGVGGRFVIVLIVAALPWWGRIDVRRDAVRIVGPGWFRMTNRGKGVWTVDDSILYVRRHSPYEKGITATFIGEKRVRRLQFDSVKDPEFQTLWSRWTTNTPRLELLADAIEPLAR